MTMKLSQLIAATHFQCSSTADPEITGVEYDSRRVQQGTLFVALPGAHVDGRTFIAGAFAAGAAAVVSNSSADAAAGPHILADNPLHALAALSAEFHGHPDKKMRLIGITGTNGKTTITYFLESILARHGLSTGVVGTVNYRYKDTVFPASNTTPQSGDIYRLFHQMSSSGVDAAVMEVSSHALALGRVRGLEFDVAVFTNLTRDHLDFHETMEDYFAAKSKLFVELRPGEKKFPKAAVINRDDPWGRKLVSLVRDAETITYGLNEKAAVRAEHVRPSSSCTEFVLVTPHGRRKVELAHIGEHNIYNALAAAGAALACGVPLETIIEGLEQAPMVPGRLEKVDEGQNFTVVVDYAHTDDALKNITTALRDLKPARLITIFGCGGDRDRSKRPLMGEVATAVSDFVFVTSDNPRSEDPQKIALDIEVGIRRQHRNNYQVVLDREQAIAAAMVMAQKGDIVLIAGKGHETYQIVGETRFHFNDTEVARKYLRQRLSANAAAQS